MSVNTLTRHRNAGEVTSIVDLLSHALVELPEFAWGGSPSQTRTRMREATEQHDRVELLAVSDGGVVGCMVLVEDDDLHVGHCLTVMWNYVLPEHRGLVGRRFLRAAFGLARQAGIPVVAYTHREGVGQYRTTYRRVREG